MMRSVDDDYDDGVVVPFTISREFMFSLALHPRRVRVCYVRPSSVQHVHDGCTQIERPD